MGTTMDGPAGKAMLSVGVDAILSHQPATMNKTKVRFLASSKTLLSALYGNSRITTTKSRMKDDPCMNVITVKIAMSFNPFKSGLSVPPILPSLTAPRCFPTGHLHPRPCQSGNPNTLRDASQWNECGTIQLLPW